MVSRANSPCGHLGALDGLRGVAILLVILFHALRPSFGTDAPDWQGWHRAWPLPGNFFVLLPAYLGWAGVPIFFVVSGFCIHLSHQRSGEHGFRGFFLRRFFRIYPPFVVAVLLFAFVLPGTRLDFHVHHNLDQLLSHLLLIHNNLGPGFLYGINPSFWSIGVEVQLYFLYPALLSLVRRLGWPAALGLIGVLEAVLRFSVACFSFDDPARLWLLGDPFLYWFSWTLGAWLCHQWLTDKLTTPSSFTLWLWPVLAVASYFFQPTYGFGFLLWALATAAALSRILSGSRRPEFSFTLFSAAWASSATAFICYTSRYLIWSALFCRTLGWHLEVVSRSSLFSFSFPGRFIFLLSAPALGRVGGWKAGSALPPPKSGSFADGTSPQEPGQQGTDISF